MADRDAHDAGRPLDTTPDAHARQRDVYLRLGGPGRLALAFELSDTIRRTTMAGIRARHPAYSDAEVHSAWARLTLGDDLCREVWPDRALVDP